MTTTIAPATVERFLSMARDAILMCAGDLTPNERGHLERAKVTYGAAPGVRGVTYYGAWKLNDDAITDFVEISAMHQESWVQLAGTLLHELGHSLAGLGSGHGAEWKAACMRLGFQIRPAAAGQTYWLAIFRPELRRALYDIAALLRDGTPNFWTNNLGTVSAVRPCRAGQGTRGGTSRGKGSGSRLRLWECQCAKPVKVRIASDDFRAHCDVCEQAFERK